LEVKKKIKIEFKKKRNSRLIKKSKKKKYKKRGGINKQLKIDDNRYGDELRERPHAIL